MRFTTIRLTLAAAVLATALPAAAQTRIGLVNFNRAVAETDEGKAAMAVLSKSLEEKQKTLSAMQAELVKLKADYDKQSSVLTEAAKREKEAELGRKEEEWQKFGMGAQQELQEAQKKALDPIAERVSGLIREVAAAEGMQLVLDSGMGVLRYADNSLDITGQIIRRYNDKFPAGGKPAASAAKPAAAPAAKPAAPATPAKK